MGRAGESSQRTYDRRRANDRAAVRRNLPVAIVFVCAAPIVVYFLVMLGAERLNEGFRDPEIFGQRPHPDVIPGDMAQMLALFLAFAATVAMARAAWGRRPTTAAYAKGAAGERQTEALLAPLERNGWVVLHDRKLPGSQENIDHIAIGPPGVFVVETKNWGAGRVVISRNKVTYARWTKDKEIDQVRRQAAAVERVLGSARMALRREALPILCIHGASVERRGLFTRPSVRGVTVCAGRRLVRVLTHKRLAVLDAGAVGELGQHLDTSLRPKTEVRRRTMEKAAVAEARVAEARVVEQRLQQCSCGGTVVERHRKSDGAGFWGCSRYPACRNTWPAPQAEPRDGNAPRALGHERRDLQAT